jgi:hypothetical protein
MKNNDVKATFLGIIAGPRKSKPTLLAANHPLGSNYSKMVSHPNAERNNTNDGDSIIVPPVTSTTASATNNHKNYHNDDSDRSSNESGDDTSTATCSAGSRSHIQRTAGNNIMDFCEDTLPVARQNCCHLKRKQDRRDHLNNALSEIRSSLDAALSAPRLPAEPVASVGSETFLSVAEVTGLPDDGIDRVDDEDNRASPLKEANRVELVNQASAIIREISRDNMRLRQEIGEMIAGRQTSLDWEKQSENDTIESDWYQT